MNTFCWLVIGILFAASGMLYSDKNKSHKKLAVGIFLVAAVASIFLGLKAIADGSTSPANSSSVTISSNSAPVVQGNTITSTNQTGGFTGINTGTVVLAPKAREISDNQASQIETLLKKYPPIPIDIEWETSKGESARYAERLAGIFNSAGYDPKPKPITMRANPPGTYFCVEGNGPIPLVAKPLQDLLIQLNIPVIWKPWGGTSGGIYIQVCGNPNE